MLKKGDKVVCVDDKVPDNMSVDSFNTIYQEWIKEGETYTIRATRNSFNGWFGVLLNEVTNPSVFMGALGGKTEPGFAEWRFRKIEEKEMEETVSKSKEEEIYAFN